MQNTNRKELKARFQINFLYQNNIILARYLKLTQTDVNVLVV